MAVLGSDSQEKILAPFKKIENVKFVLGHSFSYVASLIKNALFFMGNDSGMLQLFGCFPDTPSIGLYGPTDEARYAPLGPRDLVIKAPNSNDMSSLKVESVLSKVENHLNGFKAL